MAKHKKYITFDESDEKESYVLELLSNKRGRYLTKYVVDAVLRYESYTRAEEQKKLARFLEDLDSTPEEITMAEPETNTDFSYKTEEPVVTVEDKVSIPEAIEEPKTPKTKEYVIRNSRESEESQPDDSDDLDISEENMTSMLDAFSL